MTHICFVSMTVYPVLHGDTQLQGIGGAELQQVQIATAAAAHGASGQLRDPRSWSARWRGAAGLPGIQGVSAARRSAGPALSLSRAGPGSGVRCCVPMRMSITRVPPDSCRACLHCCGAGGRCAMSMLPRSDLDFTPDKVQIQFARDRWLFRFGLRRADAVIVQTEVQRDLLKDNYGRDSVADTQFPRCRAGAAAGIGPDAGLVGRQVAGDQAAADVCRVGAAIAGAVLHHDRSAFRG